MIDLVHLVDSVDLIDLIHLVDSIDFVDLVGLSDFILPDLPNLTLPNIPNSAFGFPHSTSRGERAYWFLRPINRNESTQRN